MKKLKSLGLTLCFAEGQTGENRIEVRIASTQVFVAWFRSHVKTSDGEEVKSTTTQFVRRHDLSEEQVQAVRKWLKQQVHNAI